jgi:hypothetical protein
MLEHILPQIRFGLMSAAEISKFVVPVKLISSDELVRLYVAKTSEAQPNAPGPDVTLASVSSSQNSYMYVYEHQIFKQSLLHVWSFISLFQI